MQRQSLGSPGRERPTLSQNDVVLKPDDQRRRDSLFSANDAITAHELKPDKPSHRSHIKLSSSNLIHSIPILIVFCFVVLYLSSHDPSPQELAQFHGIKYKHPEEVIEMDNDIDEIGRINNNKKQLKRSGAFVIRSQRNLQEEIIQRDVPKNRSHRKIGDF